MFGYAYPQFDPIYNPSSGIPPGGIQVNLPSMSTTPLPWPKNTPTTTLDKSLTALLSGLALLTRQGQIPTAAQPQQAIDYAQIAALTGNRSMGDYDGGENTGAKVENWFKNNTGVALLGAAFLAFYLLPSPRKSSR